MSHTLRLSKRQKKTVKRTPAVCGEAENHDAFMVKQFQTLVSIKNMHNNYYISVIKNTETISGAFPLAHLATLSQTMLH